MKFYQIVKLKNVLLGINFLAVLFNASLYLFISRYINENQLDYQLLTRLNSIPTSPMVIFSRSLILFFILAIIIFRQNVDLSQIKNNLIFLLELVLALAIFFSLNMAYNGIFLLVFINLFLNNKDEAEFNKYRLWLSTGFILLILFSISDQNLINEMIKAPSLSSYITFFATINRVNSFFYPQLTFFNQFNAFYYHFGFICSLLYYS